MQFLYQVLVTCAHLAFKRLVEGILEGIRGREPLRSQFYAFRRGLSRSGGEKGLGPVFLLEISKERVGSLNAMLQLVIVAVG